MLGLCGQLALWPSDLPFRPAVREESGDGKQARASTGQRVLGGGSAGPRGAAARLGEHDGGIGARQRLSSGTKELPYAAWVLRKDASDGEAGELQAAWWLSEHGAGAYGDCPPSCVISDSDTEVGGECGG